MKNEIQKFETRHMTSFECDQNSLQPFLLEIYLTTVNPERKMGERFPGITEVSFFSRAGEPARACKLVARQKISSAVIKESARNDSPSYSLGVSMYISICCH